MKPNVLLFVLDTARTDVFEPYGAPKGSTPVIADLARRGVVGRRVYATANWTLPSHVSLFTGLLPRRAGLARGVSPAAAISQWSDKVLPEVLRRSGYATFGVSANPWISTAHGFDAGFDSFDLVRSGRRSPHGGIGKRARWRLQCMRARADNGLAAVDARFSRWISRGGGRPFFAFVNLMECHSPYLPPRPYGRSSIVQRWKSASDVRRFQTERGFYEVTVGDRDVTEAAMARMHEQYRAGVRMMDDWIGRILGLLDGAGVLDDTIVVITSDHGEHFGESHRFGHVISLHDTLIRVPLVTAGPVQLPMGAPFSLAEVPIGIADAVGASHPWDETEDRSLAVAQDDGLATIHEPAARALMRAWKLPAHIEVMMRTPRDCATDGRFKLVRIGRQESLYDVDSDADEAVDVSAQHRDVAERLRRTLEIASRFEPPADAPAIATAPSVEADLEERMRLLGYL